MDGRSIINIYAFFVSFFSRYALGRVTPSLDWIYFIELCNNALRLDTRMGSLRNTVWPIQTTGNAHRSHTVMRDPICQSNTPSLMECDIIEQLMAATIVINQFT